MSWTREEIEQAVVAALPRPSTFDQSEGLLSPSRELAHLKNEVAETFVSYPDSVYGIVKASVNRLRLNILDIRSMLNQIQILLDDISPNQRIPRSPEADLLSAQEHLRLLSIEVGTPSFSRRSAFLVRDLKRAVRRLDVVRDGKITRAPGEEIPKVMSMLSTVRTRYTAMMRDLGQLPHIVSETEQLGVKEQVIKAHTDRINEMLPFLFRDSIQYPGRVSRILLSSANAVEARTADSTPSKAKYAGNVTSVASGKLTVVGTKSAPFNWTQGDDIVFGLEDGSQVTWTLPTPAGQVTFESSVLEFPLAATSLMFKATIDGNTDVDVVVATDAGPEWTNIASLVSKLTSAVGSHFSVSDAGGGKVGFTLLGATSPWRSVVIGSGILPDHLNKIEGSMYRAEAPTVVDLELSLYDLTSEVLATRRASTVYTGTGTVHTDGGGFFYVGMPVSMVDVAAVGDGVRFSSGLEFRVSSVVGTWLFLEGSVSPQENLSETVVVYRDQLDVSRRSSAIPEISITGGALFGWAASAGGASTDVKLGKKFSEIRDVIRPGDLLNSSSGSYKIASLISPDILRLTTKLPSNEHTDISIVPAPVASVADLHTAVQDQLQLDVTQGVTPSSRLAALEKAVTGYNSGSAGGWNREVSKFRAQLDSIDSALSIFTAREVPEISAIITRLKSYGLDRAADLLTSGHLQEFMSVQPESATYRGWLLEAVAEVGSELPIPSDFDLEDAEELESGTRSRSYDPSEDGDG